MIINALNSGAKVFMADFEDANSPTWANMIEGQINLKDRWAGKIDFTDPTTGKAYKLGTSPPSCSCARAAGICPKRISSSTASRCPASLFDFGLYVFHNAKAALAAGHRAPISTCPSSRAISRRGCGTRSSSAPRRALGLPLGTIKATVLIETLPAAFEMDEILYELRDHIVGPQLRPLGLHLLLHQDARATTATSSCPTAARW